MQLSEPNACPDVTPLCHSIAQDAEHHRPANSRVSILTISSTVFLDTGLTPIIYDSAMVLTA